MALFILSLYRTIGTFSNYRNVNVSLKPLSLSFEEIKEMMCMKRMIFSFSLFIVCIGNKCADNVGRMSTEDARKLSVNFISMALVEKTKEYNLENAAKGYLPPQFALSAKGFLSE